jgi:hypothetical protein
LPELQVNWLHKKWVQTAAYWSLVVTLMLADGSLGWDDVVIFFVAVWGYFKLVVASNGKRDL